MSRELTLEEAENIVDNMYQNRWKECGVEDDNTIHMGNLDNLQYNELESASILLLRTEIRLQQENQELKNTVMDLQKELNEENLQCSKYAMENQELKKQLEVAKLVRSTCGFCPYYKTKEEKENQQKEFIDWLENKIKIINETYLDNGNYNEEFLQEMISRKIAYKDSLSKYKEIIGMINK